MTKKLLILFLLLVFVQTSYGGNKTITGEISGNAVQLEFGHNIVVTAGQYLKLEGVTGTSATGYVMPRNGSIIGISGANGLVISCPEFGELPALTTYHDYNARINGANTGAWVQTTECPIVKKGAAQFPRGKYPFKAGDTLQAYYKYNSVYTSRTRAVITDVLVVFD